MQRIIGIFLLLLGLGWLACMLPASSNPEPSQATSWRRTSEGWQSVDKLKGESLRQSLLMHPAVVGAVLLFLALAAIIGMAPEEHATRRQQAEAWYQAKAKQPATGNSSDHKEIPC
jgi:hypothetical protein